MARKKKFTDPTDLAICEIHRRFVKVMEDVRIETISDETKQHYLAIMISLTDKLGVPAKPLSEIVGEMMSEAAPLLFQTMQR